MLVTNHRQDPNYRTTKVFACFVCEIERNIHLRVYRLCTTFAPHREQLCFTTLPTTETWKPANSWWITGRRKMSRINTRRYHRGWLNLVCFFKFACSDRWLFAIYDYFVSRLILLVPRMIVDFNSSAIPVLSSNIHLCTADPGNECNQK